MLQDQAQRLRQERQARTQQQELQQALESEKLMQVRPEPTKGLAFPDRPSAAFLHHLDDGIGRVA